MKFKSLFFLLSTLTPLAMCNQMCPDDLTGVCVQDFELRGLGDERNLTSCGFDDGLTYDPYLDCTSEVGLTNADHFMAIEVMAVEIESCADCACDSLTLYDETSSDPLAQFCGSQTGTGGKEYICLEQGSKLLAFFRTDGSAERRGFRLLLSERDINDSEYTEKCL